MKKILQEKIRVAVLYGGISHEREVSLQTGDKIVDSLSSLKKYEVSRICIRPDGKWISESDTSFYKKNQCVDLQELSKIIDIVFIALHGKFGEDGTVQLILDKANIAYTGSGSKASALGMNKSKCSQVVMSHVLVPIPDFFQVQKTESLESILENIKKHFSFPCVIKPNASGSSLGVSLVHSLDEISEALQKAWIEDENIIIQKYISGREFSCGIMGNADDIEYEVLPVIEIVTKDADFFDYTSKYTPNASKETCPANISQEISSRIQDFSLRIHKTLGCDGLTRSDFLLDRDGNIFFLEINTVPGQTETSLCPKEALAKGIPFSEFLEKQIGLALGKK